jgi:hypothetical protein
VNLAMITDAAAVNGIDVGAFPELKQFRILIYAHQQLLELPISSCGNIDTHRHPLKERRHS